MAWNKCLSHQVWTYIEKGWKDEGRPVHFLWGLGGSNLNTIRDITEKGEEWWYVDVGYLTEQITRYPEPSIHDLDKTYFRICKGLSVQADEIVLLNKTLQPLPEKFHGLTDQETRYRQRYVDLISNPDSRRLFQTRSKIIHNLRQYFVEHDYLEVETPMMEICSFNDITLLN